MSKFIFVTGGVVSGIGKGILAASIGALLVARGVRVSMMKCDPYLNVDAGTMSPHQHGEVFVLRDGTETDLDLGHYERFIDEDLDSLSSVTSGSVYSSVIARERRGGYLGATVQLIPHVTNQIKDCIRLLSKQSKAEVVVVEIGGTVGDIEGLPFLEAIRQLRHEGQPRDLLCVHTTLVPYLDTSGELKTKPTQHSTSELRSRGIQPDVVVCRSRQPISRKLREKVALFCDVRLQEVISLPDLDSIYRVPLYLEREGFSPILDNFLGEGKKPNMDRWEQLDRILSKTLLSSPSKGRSPVRVGLVGKYTGMRDTYLSVTEALQHAALAAELALQIQWIPAEKLENQEVGALLDGLDGVIVPGGFDTRGVEGKIVAVRYAREQGLPFFGLCLGLQCAVIEFARHVCAMDGANSTEFDSRTCYPVIDFLPGQREKEEKGGTMRLGAYPCEIMPGSQVDRAYALATRESGSFPWQQVRGKAKLSAPARANSLASGRVALPYQATVWERHRHRYEINSQYLSALERAGLVVSGWNKELNLAEIVELPDHPWFLATQFHPEFTSRPGKPNPLFLQFVNTCAGRAHKRWKS